AEQRRTLLDLVGLPHERVVVLVREVAELLLDERVAPGHGDHVAPPRGGAHERAEAAHLELVTGEREAARGPLVALRAEPALEGLGERLEADGDVGLLDRHGRGAAGSSWLGDLRWSRGTAALVNPRLRPARSAPRRRAPHARAGRRATPRTRPTAGAGTG